MFPKKHAQIRRSNTGFPKTRASLLPQAAASGRPVPCAALAGWTLPGRRRNRPGGAQTRTPPPGGTGPLSPGLGRALAAQPRVPLHRAARSRQSWQDCVFAEG